MQDSIQCTPALQSIVLSTPYISLPGGVRQEYKTEDQDNRHGDADSGDLDPVDGVVDVEGVDEGHPESGHQLGHGRQPTPN